MVISLSLPLFLLSLHTVAGLDERACIFCLSFKFCCLKKLQMWAARHTYTKMLDRKKQKLCSVDKEKSSFTLLTKHKMSSMIFFGLFCETVHAKTVLWPGVEHDRHHKQRTSLTQGFVHVSLLISHASTKWLLSWVTTPPK